MNLSKEIKIGAFLCVVFLGIIFFSVSGKAQPKSTVIPSTSPTPTIQSNTTSFTLAEVAKHNKQSDCWIVINNNVYNATDYLFAHPGGASAITPYCGGDATTAFKGMRKHNSRADADLSTIIIGTLK